MIEQILKILIVENYNLYSSIDMNISMDVFLDIKTEFFLDEVGGRSSIRKCAEAQMDHRV